MRAAKCLVPAFCLGRRLLPGVYEDPEAAQELIDMGIKLINYDSEWTGANKDMIIEKWNNAISADKLAE